MSEVVASFKALYAFGLDRFQHVAINALEDGRSVLVAAPTGAGKTVIGEFACHAALARGGKCFYTTPIKALSNQKYRDLCGRYGDAKVGLLTGDRSINGGASVVVMTTEVLRNMIYEQSSTLVGLQHVVLDEVHYLADRSRGAVWEEIIIQLPASVQLACLSATVSNAEEFGEWLHAVRDGCEVVIEDHRPVPLGHHYWVNDRLYPTFRAGQATHKGSTQKQRNEAATQARGGVPNPEVVMLERRASQRNRVSGRGRRQAADVKLRYPDRSAVVEELRRRQWLPAILFVFSRQGCEDAVAGLVRAGVRLTDRDERDEIAALVDTITADIPQHDLDVLGHRAFRSALMDGVAAHHAGMIPLFKEVVEVCFQRGLLKVVVATETLALGINMPAKTVVIERLEKWNGESHVLLDAGQYTQLTGRAGRRGIDKRGNAIVLYQRSIDFGTVAGLVGTRTYPLRSSFAPSYNMAVNLLRRHDLAEAEALLGASFAQFQADRSVAGTSRPLPELERAMKGYAQHLHSDVGDWTEYWRLRRELSRAEKASARDRRRAHSRWLQSGIASLQPGDVLHLPWLGRRGMAAVVGVKETAKGTLLAQLVTDDRAMARIGPRELDTPPTVIGHVRIPNSGNIRQKEYRRAVSDQLRGLEPPSERPTSDGPPRDEERLARLADLRAAFESHACHTDPRRKDIEVWQYRYDDAADEVDRIKQEVERRSGSLIRQLHRILAVLGNLGYVDDGPAPTDRGELLAGVYAETDLLVAEAIRLGLLDDLSSTELAGICALFTYEARREDNVPWDLGTDAMRSRVGDLIELAADLRELERRHDVEPLRDLDPGFVGPAWRWAQGFDLEDALGELDMTGGDFVRNIKQLADLVGQLKHVGRPALSAAADATLDRLRRGIVDA